MKEVRVNRKAAGRIASGHPWIFSSDVDDRDGAAPGDAVRVVDPAKRLLGTAHYSSTSQITLRMLSPRAEEVGQTFLAERLRAAADFRRKAVQGTDAYRLVFGEADQLPGLVVDRYGDCLAMQTLDQGMDGLSSTIVDCLKALCEPRLIVARNDVAVRTRESLPLETKVLHGTVPDEVVITMNGLRLQVDLLGGQKTGIFLDQRENYVAAARWAHGRALDCFTCTGGFALHMAGHCAGVEAADSSGAALQTAEENRKANRIDNVQFLEANAFDLLAGHAAAGRKFQTIVLDPPAFAKSRSNVEGALRGYKEINLRALKLLDAGGVLVTCSCSHHVSEAMLLELIAQAALDAHKTVRVLERRTQSADHPILLTVPETHYLKCLILQVIP
ncbi:MAG TPA: class I SAM-dependent rRNA methyltransferase [Bryobacteraceae bacterium]|nr:class I SAM-dependent rRNA methyltransferase [Bryobacteraceae bacterium]